MSGYRIVYVPPPDGLDQVNRKIARAKKHLEALELEIERLLEAHDEAPIIEDDLESGDKHVYFPLPKMTPAMGLIAADYVICLRSSLDYLAWQLAKLTTFTPFKKTAFPVQADACKNFAAFRKRESQAIRSIAIEPLRIIEDLQPYHRGDAYKDTILWRLHNLSNIAKHRAVPSFGTAREISFYKPQGVKCRRLDGGHMVFSGPADKLEDVELEPAPPIKIIFGEFPFGIQATIEDLRGMHEFVRDDVVPRFSGFFAEAEGS